MKYFLLFIIAMPVIEIIVLLLSGNVIGFWPTLFLIVSTGLIGAYLAKRQGMETWKKAQEQIRYGMMPGNEIIDGICIFLGAALLLSPGLISDIIGLILVFPPTRNLLKPIVIRFIMNRMNKGKVTIIRHK
ncbi:MULTISPECIES: FxsA family protein [unclassified Peribacillus]|uniref:FxsA family protein n=1 Tax=unclassified Peribacillus TaxID=2675266 RepID=UPI0019134505|nr:MULTISPECIES: FxsA family protein [unclassified Peribacillus]MBK5442916.1 membrane protein FxsA [Peribacillus sp. TH24]MBK5462345.1 membrane protein FxsA [Peribacillus sp. TH27]MBK5484318.1 membrane protein FxsA [Peribacillus sp. TH16]MBK5500495.1 membrane protein FxsA [Peribacillus sp. TH14]